MNELQLQHKKRVNKRECFLLGGIRTETSLFYSTWQTTPVYHRQMWCDCHLQISILHSFPADCWNKKQRGRYLSQRWEFSSKAFLSRRILPGLLYRLEVIKFEWALQGWKMWSFGSIFSKNFSKALREVMEKGQWVKESHCALHCSAASPSPSQSSLEAAQCQGCVGAEGTAGAVSATEPPECHCWLQRALLASPRAQKCLWNWILLCTSLHWTEVCSSVTSQSCLHCPWNPEKLTALLRPTWQQVMLILLLGYLYWFQHKIALGLGIQNMLIFLLEVRFKCRFVTQKQQQT